MPSKYQNIAQSKAKSSSPKGQGKRPKYYDEELITTSQSKSSSGAIMAIGLISLLIIGGGITGILLTRDPDPTTTTTTTTITTTTTTTSSIFVEPGDTINIHYTLWTAAPGSGLDGVVDMEHPVQDDIFEATATKNSLINGFYYEILGMVYMEEKTFSIAACRDEDGDGLDDYTGLEPLGYYDPLETLYDTNLVFYVQITYIAKV